jgi:SAM-dependent methyltransferase
MFRSVARLLSDKWLFNSRSYWEKRYRSGGNSGAGSYNQLAVYKAVFLNRFVVENNIANVLEFGCGDGAQLSLAKYPAYVGIDVSKAAVEMCKARFAGDPTKRFYLHGDAIVDGLSADLSMSLDVIYHLIEEPVFDRYMKRLFASSRKYVAIYSSNYESERVAAHLRHRKFSDWVGVNRRDFSLTRVAPNPYPWDASRPSETSFADFFIYEQRS